LAFWWLATGTQPTTAPPSKWLEILHTYERGAREQSIDALVSADIREIARQQDEALDEISRAFDVPQTWDRGSYWRRQRVWRSQLAALLNLEAAARLPPHAAELVAMAHRPIDTLLEMRSEYRKFGPPSDLHAETMSAFERETRGQLEWERLRDFCRQWFRAAAALALHVLDARTTLTLLDRGLDLSPDDPELLLARGALAERAAWAGIVDRSLAETLYGKLHLRAVREQYEAAERDFRRALSHGPRVEATLRLGRVAQLQGRTDEARAAFEQVLAQSSAAPFEHYHARLFLGELFEDLNAPSSASAQYVEAIVLMPVAQAPAMALSRLSDASGDSAGARRWLTRSLVAAGPDREDPWWRYASGQLAQLSERLVRLRELRVEVSP
jgi:tetratricopeptide (TPR) repeat protein